MSEKVCSKCKQVKPFGEFRKHPKGPQGLSCRCKSCLKEQDQAYYEKNKHKWVEREALYRAEDPEEFRQKGREAQARYRAGPHNTVRLRYLKWRYNLTVEQYEEMLKAQQGLCWICGRPPKSRGKATRLHVDHCHKTGKVRGLLCYPCNTLLGNAEDNPAILEKAIAYLRQHTPPSEPTP